MHFVRFPIATPINGLVDWVVSVFDISSIDPDYGGRDRCVLYTRGLSAGRTIQISATEARNRIQEVEKALYAEALSPLIEAIELCCGEIVEAINNIDTNPGHGHGHDD